MDKQFVRQQLEALAEEKYRLFSARLLPTVDATRILGVRLPLLRKMAKQIAKTDWKAYLNQASTDSFEEIMLQGMVIAYIKCSFEERLNYIQRFIPLIDNWSVCDSFCTSLKPSSDERPSLWVFLKPYWQSTQAYDIRFAVVMVICHFIDESYLADIFQRFDTIKHEDYYVKMAIAWAISMCYVKYPQITMDYLLHNHLDDFTYNKALQKIIESLQVNAETKAQIRLMKRTTSKR